VCASMRTNTDSDGLVFMHEQFGSSIDGIVVRAIFCGKTDNVSGLWVRSAFREHNEYLFTLISKSDCLIAVIKKVVSYIVFLLFFQRCTSRITIIFRWKRTYVKIDIAALAAYVTTFIFKNNEENIFVNALIPEINTNS